MMFSAKKTITLACLSGGALATAALLQILGIILVGPGVETDAYFAAQTVPLVLGSIASSALLNNLTPLLAKQGIQEGGAMVRQVMLSLLMPLAIVVALASMAVIHGSALLFPGLSDASLQAVRALAPLLCAVFGLNLLSSAAMAGHYARGSFLHVEKIQAVTALCALIALVPVVDRYGVIGFAWLLIARSASLLAILGYAFLRESGTPADDMMRTLWLQVRHIMAGSMIFKLGPAIDRSIASFAFPGALTFLGVGQQVMGSLGTIADRVLARPLLTASGANSGPTRGQQMLAGYRRQLNIVIWSGLVLGVAIALCLAFVGERIADSLQFHSAEPLELIAWIVMAAVPAAAGQMSASLMYSLGKAKEISRLAMISFLLSTAVKILGFILFGIYAIVFGIFLYQFLNWFLLHKTAMRVMGSRQVVNGEEGREETMGFRIVAWSPPCPLCNGMSFEKLAEADRYAMGIKTSGCAQCGLVQTWPRPTPENMDEFYRFHYRSYYQGVAAPDAIYSARYKKNERLAYTANTISRHVELKPGARVLDVGCAEGTLFLELAKIWDGLTLVGVEPSESFASYARTRTGCTTYADINTLLTSDDKAFDLIVVNHVLEHVNNPVDFLLRLSRVLAPEGVIYIDVPNVERYGSLESLHIAHLFHFSSRTLAAVLSCSGLKAMNLLCHEPPHHPPSVLAIAKKDSQQEDVVFTPDAEITAWKAVRRVQQLAFLYSASVLLRRSRLGPYLVKFQKFIKAR